VKMRITAFTLGSFGDVMPFVILGRELINRGYDYRIATYEDFRKKVEAFDIPFIKISGDSGEMVSVLLSDSNNGAGEGMNGLRYLLNKYPEMYTDFYNACKDSDLVMYMQFGSPAYHFAEKFGIPAIRTYVFPFDPTSKYCALSETMKRDSLFCRFKNFMCRFFMANAARDIMNEWRVRLGLRPNGRFHDYTKLNGQKMLTLYQYDEVLAPIDPKWIGTAYLTGNWIAPDEHENFPGKKELEEFLNNGEPPVFVGFGSMNYKDIVGLYEKVIRIVMQETDKRIIVPGVCAETVKEKFSEFEDRIFIIGFVPFEYLFPRMRAVIHHGGNGTVHAALRSSVPQMVMAFGADQMFWGGQCFYLGIGPAPVNVKKTIDERLLKEKIVDLTSNRTYKTNSLRLAGYVTTDGAKTAAELISKKYPKEESYGKQNIDR